MFLARCLTITLLAISWVAPHAVAVGIHAHELLEHAPEHVGMDCFSVHSEGHEHEVPGQISEQALFVRGGKQRVTLATGLAIAPVVGPKLIPQQENSVPSPVLLVSRDGPPLPILHCSFLI